MTADTLEREFSAIAARLTAARGRTAAGATVDLGDLPARIERLCQALTARPDTPPDPTLEARFGTLIDGLEALEQATRTALADITGRLDQVDPTG